MRSPMKLKELKPTPREFMRLVKCSNIREEGFRSQYQTSCEKIEALGGYLYSSMIKVIKAPKNFTKLLDTWTSERGAEFLHVITFDTVCLWSLEQYVNLGIPSEWIDRDELAGSLASKVTPMCQKFGRIKPTAHESDALLGLLSQDRFRVIINHLETRGAIIRQQGRCLNQLITCQHFNKVLYSEDPAELALHQRMMRDVVTGSNILPS